MREMNDLTGMRFGRLVVIGLGEKYKRPNGYEEARWRCRCDCGNTIDVLPRNLITGNSRSCGCGRHSWYTFTEKERKAMSIPKPDPITIQDELRIGKRYVVKKEPMILIGLYETFARFRRMDGTHVCYLYWDLNEWKKEARMR